MPAMLEGRCKHTGEKYALPTNPDKGYADNRYINIQTVRGRANQWLQVHKCMDPDETHRFVKINSDRTIYKNLKYIYLE